MPEPGDTLTPGSADRADTATHPLRHARVAIIGCGLMGGSFALAARAAGLAGTVVGYSPTPASVQTALTRGVIDEAAASAQQAAAGADLVLLAVPVGAMATVFTTINPVLGDDTLVMDVGSTKQDVIAAARAGLGPRQLRNYVPAHPIAGKERAGAGAADAALYRGRRTILTPLPETRPTLTAEATALWQAIGCNVVPMTAERHDAIFAAVSHLPHLLAFAYVNGLLAQADGAELMAYGGPGFRDFSRIAGSDPAMWRDVLLANRDAVLAQSRAFRQALEQLEASLQPPDGMQLQAQITRASQARGDWVLSTAAPAMPGLAPPAS